MKNYVITPGNILNRRELKKIKGGGSVTPGTPGGGETIRLYKCCLKSNPTICSACIECTASCTCASNANLTTC